MSGQRKLLIYTHAMAGGGAERVCASLASGFVRRGDNVLLAVDYEARDNSAYVDTDVQHLALGKGHFWNVIHLARALRREKPDVVMSALGISNLKLTIAALLSGYLSRSILSYHGFASNEPQFLSRVAYWLTPLETRITAATVCVSESLRNYIIATWWASTRRTVRIFNPVAIRLAEKIEVQNVPMVLAVGRLNRQKNFPGLVRAFGLIAHTDAKLVILGEGPERKLIETEIVRLGLSERVRLAGYVR